MNMKDSNPIKRKYNLYVQAKKMIIFLGIFTTLSLLGYALLDRIGVGLGSVLMLVLSMISLILFVFLWIALVPMRRHILRLIEEYER